MATQKDHHLNIKWTKHWMETPRKMPPFLSFNLVESFDNQPDCIFHFNFVPPRCYPKGNYSNPISLMLLHEDYIKEFNATWTTYCDMAWKLNEEIKMKASNLE